MSSTRFDVDLDALTDAELTERLRSSHVEKNRLEAEVIALTRAFDRRGLYALDGARTTAGWLTARVDQTRTQNGRDVDLGRTLESMPVVSAAFGDGRIGRAKVDLLVETRTPEIAAVFAQHEGWLVDEVADLRVCDARRFLRAWHENARLLIGSIDPDEPVVESAPDVAVGLAQTFDGRFVLTGEMDAENGLIIRGAIDAEIEDMFRHGTFTTDDGLTPAQRRGQALVQIVSRKGHAGFKHGRPRPSVEVICDERTLQGLPIESPQDAFTRICQLIDGTPLPPASLSRLLCGADLHRLVIAADGEILDAGKTIHVRRPHPPPYRGGFAAPSRSGNRAQRRALRFRHARHCAFPGCDAPDDWCEAHHIDDWNPDPTNPHGATDMANLIPLCRYHHHRIHEGGYTLTLSPDGEVQVLRPPDHHGRRCRTTPSRPWRRPLVPTG